MVVRWRARLVADLSLRNSFEPETPMASALLGRFDRAPQPSRSRCFFRSPSVA